jgi:hypothetical protein
MTLQNIDNLSDGVFVDWEILNKLIYNVKQIDKDVPTIRLNSTVRVQGVGKNKVYSNKGSSANRMSIEAGRKKFTNLRDKDTIRVNTGIDGNGTGTPCVIATMEGTGVVKMYITNVNDSGFTINLDNTSSSKKDGVVNWMVIRARPL